VRFKGALVLFVLSLLIGGVYFLYILPAQKEAERKRQLKERIFTVSADEIDYIRLINRGQDYRLEKTANGWMLVKPKRLIADQKIISKIIEVLNKERIIKVVATDLKRMDEFGLTSPVIYAAFGHRGGLEEFFIGRPAPAKAGAYLYKKGLDGIFLVSLDVAGALNQTLYGLRKKEPFVFDETAIKKIVIERKDDRLEMVRKENGWFMLSPVKGRCSDKAVWRFIEEMKTLRADEFYDGKKPKPSDYDKSVRIKLFFDDKTEVMDVYFWGTEYNKGLVLYQHGLDYFARTNQRDFWNSLHESAWTFRYKNLFDVNPEDVYAITGRMGEETITLKRKGNRWFSSGRKLSEDRVYAFIQMLNGIEAYGITEKDFIKTEKYFSLLLKDRNGKDVASLYVYGEAKIYSTSFDLERGDIKVFYAESSNLTDKCLVTNFQVEDLYKSLKKLVAEESE
jgi:hypothetical protein